jgi:hypothetical protein
MNSPKKESKRSKLRSTGDSRKAAGPAQSEKPVLRSLRDGEPVDGSRRAADPPLREDTPRDKQTG